MTIRTLTLLLAALCVSSTVPAAHAQEVDPTPSQRQLRTYIPPDQVVSFLPGTPFNEFATLLNPIFMRVTGKQVIDPEGRTTPIGVSISGMHFIDAFELVLERQGLGFRETDSYFIIEPIADTIDAQVVGANGAAPRDGERIELPATALSRELRIDAHIFELDLTRLKEIGTNWASIFGQQGGGAGGGTGGGGTGGGGTGQDQQGLRFFLNTESAFDAVDGIIEGPNRVDFADLVRLFRYFESVGAGETIASPSVTVQSGEQGRIQSGSDIPVTLQDFAGNTVTQYIATGVIIDVTPTLISDASDARRDPEIEPVEFIHLDVTVEKSSGSPSAAGITIDKNQTDTQVLLLDGEQTVIGGLFSTEESISRRGVPILKDIPLIKYLFSYQTTTTTQRELLIVLQARVMDPLRTRAGRPFPTNIYARERQDVQQRLDRFKPGASEDLQLIDPDDVK